MKRTYRETLDFLYSQLPMYQRMGSSAFKKDLTNIRKLCDALGNPQQQFPSIHIAGTNGKGSTAHMLSAVLQASGRKVGLYTSPHYRDFRERIKLDGQLATKRFVVDFVHQHERLFEEIQPSFFEITVAMAFVYFAEQNVDVAVIETGLGGRLDSTNIISPICSVITNISYDHQQFLGDTLPEIAGEKAGIIKPGVPVVIGERHPETTAVFVEKAAREQAPITFAEDELQVSPLQSNVQGMLVDVKQNGASWLSGLLLEAYGEYQYKNLATALQTIRLIQPHLPVEEMHIRLGLAQLKDRTRFRGRWQLLGKQPLTLGDSAHNEAGLKLVLEELKRIPHQQLHFVLGMVRDKDVEKVVHLLPDNALYYFACPDIPRGLEVAVLAEKAQKAGLKGRAYASVANALRAARRAASADDLVYVGGSTFVLAEVVE